MKKAMKFKIIEEKKDQPVHFVIKDREKKENLSPFFPPSLIEQYSSPVEKSLKKKRKAGTDGLLK